VDEEEDGEDEMDQEQGREVQVGGPRGGGGVVEPVTRTTVVRCQ
jgi:hypothetical protein